MVPRNADQSVEFWRRLQFYAANGDSSDPKLSLEPDSRVQASPPGKLPFEVLSYGTPGGASVEYVKVQGLAHGWTGGKEGYSYTDPSGPSATLLIQDFILRKQPVSRGLRRKGRRSCGRLLR